MKDPAFLFYSSDFLSGVMDLDMLERGQYITLLCAQHQKGHLSEKTIRLLVGSCSVSVLDKFETDSEGNFFNKRLDEEIQKRVKFSESRKNNGINGGRPKKIKQDYEQTDWGEMLQFFDNKCICCGYKFEEGVDRPTKDHIKPRAGGGTDDISNLQPLCRQCNSSKCADHTTDYRLNYEIPSFLRKKWFKDNLPETYRLLKTKPSENLPENENENKDIVDKVEIEIGENSKKTESDILSEKFQSFKDYIMSEAILFQVGTLINSSPETTDKLRRFFLVENGKDMAETCESKIKAAKYFQNWAKIEKNRTNALNNYDRVMKKLNQKLQ